MPHPISKLPQLFLALRHLAEFIHQMQHRIAWQGIVQFLCLALSAHLIHGARQILSKLLRSLVPCFHSTFPPRLMLNLSF